jgi:hypothetical protein
MTPATGGDTAFMGEWQYGRQSDVGRLDKALDMPGARAGR